MAVVEVRGWKKRATGCEGCFSSSNESSLSVHRVLFQPGGRILTKPSLFATVKIQEGERERERNVNFLYDGGLLVILAVYVITVCCTVALFDPRGKDDCLSISKREASRGSWNYQGWWPRRCVKNFPLPSGWINRKRRCVSVSSLRRMKFQFGWIILLEKWSWTIEGKNGNTVNRWKLKE